MDNTFRRTSVTIGEAVAILIGWVDGPVVYTCASESPTYEEQEEIESMLFDLHEFIEDEETRLENAYDDAKDDKLPAAIVAEKREALKAFRKKIQQAKTCLCAIKDEINRGDPSELATDTELSSDGCRYITLASLARWAKKMKYAAQILVDLPVGIETTITIKQPMKPAPAPRRKMLDQVAAIKAEIRKLGHDPKNIPSNDPGKDGVKAQVRKALEGSPLFKATTAFRKAWEEVNRDAREGLD